MPDMVGREWAAILPMIILMIWLGVAPQTFLPSIGASNAAMLATTKGRLEQQVNLAPNGAMPQLAQETAHAK
jgi:NADH:ubiquinone oxidoreductase subunit 4 (subunit M)